MTGFHLTQDFVYTCLNVFMSIINNSNVFKYKMKKELLSTFKTLQKKKTIKQKNLIVCFSLYLVLATVLSKKISNIFSLRKKQDTYQLF